MKIVHIINPYISNENNNKIVNLTMDSMEVSKENTKVDDVEIELCYTCYDEDLILVNERSKFKRLSLLDRSVLDLYDFKIKRKLPLLFDILNKIDEIECDYMIYTNIDIHVVPEFYNEVIKYIKSGYDCLTINRVTIYSENILSKSIKDIYPLVKEGEFHPGLDCFVFQKKVFDKLEKYNFCIGTSSFDKYLYSYIHKFSDNGAHLLKPYLTFHIGDDREWLDGTLNDYIEYNKSVYQLCNSYINNNVKCINNCTIIDDFIFYSKYNGSYCENKEDQKIISFLKNNKIFSGSFLDIRSNQRTDASKVLFLSKIGWSGYILETNPNNIQLLINSHINDKKVTILHTDLILENFLNPNMNGFKFITLSVPEYNFNILKTFPISLLHNCLIISVDYYNMDDFNNILFFLQIYGFNNIVDKNAKCVILSKF